HCKWKDGRSWERPSCHATSPILAFRRGFWWTRRLGESAAEVIQHGLEALQVAVRFQRAIDREGALVVVRAEQQHRIVQLAGNLAHALVERAQGLTGGAVALQVG